MKHVQVKVNGEVVYASPVLENTQVEVTMHGDAFDENGQPDDAYVATLTHDGIMLEDNTHGSFSDTRTDQCGGGDSGYYNRKHIMRLPF